MTQIAFTALTPDAMARLTRAEQAAFMAAAVTVAQDQKPPLEVTVTLLLALQRLLTEPDDAARAVVRIRPHVPAILRALNIAAAEALYPSQRRHYTAALAELADVTGLEAADGH